MCETEGTKTTDFADSATAVEDKESVPGKDTNPRIWPTKEIMEEISSSESSYRDRSYTDWTDTSREADTGRRRGINRANYKESPKRNNQEQRRKRSANNPNRRSRWEDQDDGGDRYSYADRQPRESSRQWVSEVRETQPLLENYREDTRYQSKNSTCTVVK